MTIIPIFLLNAVLSFALSLVVASLVGPAEFGRYAVGLSIAVVVNTTLFEWLRLSTTRFYSERVRMTAPGVRATLGRAYAASTLALVALLGLGLAFGVRLGLSDLTLAAAAVAGLTLGLFDYRTALARARFHGWGYAALVLVRGIGGFAFAAGAAWLTRDPAAILAGSALAAILAIALTQQALADPAAPGAAPDRALLRAFARYAVPLVAASALYQMLPLANRLLLASRDGYAQAGYFSLASELGSRLFQNLGSALDLVLFQIAVRTEELHGRAAAEHQIARNIAIVAAIVFPAAAGLVAGWPSFEALFVPAAFRGRIAPAMMLLIPALAAFALIQYALNPVFQLRRRTAPVIAAAAIAVAVDLALVLLWPGLAGPEGFAMAQLAGVGLGCVALGAAAMASGAALPWRDLARAAAATAVMVAAVWPLRHLASPAVTLAIQVALGAVVFGALALALDIAGGRGFASRLRPRLGLAARTRTGVR